MEPAGRANDVISDADRVLRVGTSPDPSHSGTAIAFLRFDLGDAAAASVRRGSDLVSAVLQLHVRGSGSNANNVFQVMGAPTAASNPHMMPRQTVSTLHFSNLVRTCLYLEKPVARKALGLRWLELQNHEPSRGAAQVLGVPSLEQAWQDGELTWESCGALLPLTVGKPVARVSDNFIRQASTALLALDSRTARARTRLNCTAS